MKTAEEALKNEEETSATDEVYEYDGTNAQYLLPTVEDANSSEDTVDNVDNTVTETSFLDNVKGFFKDASEYITDSFKFTGESFSFEEPKQETPDVLGNLYRQNVEWGLGMELPSRPMSQEEYNAYIEDFKKKALDVRYQDSVELVSRLVEEGAPLDKIKRLIRDIKDMKELPGASALFKAGQEQDALSTMEDDPQAVVNQMSSTEGNVNFVANLKAFNTFLEQKRKGYYENTWANRFKAIPDVLIPFAPSYRATQVARGELKEVFKKAGVGDVLESFYINPNEFFADLRKAFFVMGRKSPEEFQTFLDDVDTVLQGNDYTNFYALDLYEQIFNPDEIANVIGNVADVAFLTPAVGLTKSSVKALGKARGAVKAARKQVTDLKKQGKTVESVDKAIAEEEQNILKATSKKEAKAAEGRLEVLKEEQRILRGDYVAAAESVERTTKAMVAASGMNLASEIVPGLTLATRGLFVGVSAPWKLAKAVGNYVGASRQLSKGLVEAVADNVIDVNVHKKNLENISQVIDTGFQPYVFKDGVALSASPNVRKTVEFLTEGGQDLLKLKDAEAVKRLYEELSGKLLLPKVIRESLEPAAKRVATKLDKVLTKSKLPRSVTVGVERRGNDAVYVSRISASNGRGLSRDDAEAVLGSYKSFKKLRGMGEEVDIIETADGFHVDFSFKLKKTPDESSYSSEGFKSIDDIVYDNVKGVIRGEEKKDLSGGVFGFLMNHTKGLSQTVTSFQRIVNDIIQHDQGVVHQTLAALQLKIEKGNDKVVEYLINRVRAESTWFKPDYLRSLGMSKKTIEAYEAYKNLSDLSWLLYRRNLVKNLKQTGMHSVGFYRPTGEGQLYSELVDIGIGKRTTLKEIQNGNNDFLYVKDYNNEVDDFIGDLNSEDVLKNPDDFAFYKTLYSSHGTNYVAVRKHSLKETEVDELSLDVSYIPGRMLFSPFSGFIKQAVSNDKGKVIDIRTIFAHPDFYSTRKAAQALEEMRQLVIKVDKGQMSEEAAREAFGKIANRELVAARYSDWDAFKNSCKGEDPLFSLHPQDRIQVVEDGGKLEGLPADTDQEFFNFKGASFLSYSNFEKIVEKRMRTDSNIYNPFTIGNAPRMTATEEIATNIHNIVNLSTKAEYTTLLAEDMVRLFKGKGIDSIDVARNALLNGAPRGLNSDVKEQVDHMSRAYRTLFGMPTSFDISLEKMMQKIASKICPDYAGEGGLRTSTYYAIRNMSPLKKTQALAFHWYLGLLNPRQFYKQASAILVTAQMSPKAGAQAMTMGVPFMIYMMSRDGSLGQRIAKAVNISKKDLDLIAETVNRLDVSTRGSYSGALDLDAATETRWKLTSTWFYDAGERINHYNSALVTVLEALNEGKNLRKLTDTDIAGMLTRQNTLYLNMGRAGMSPIQTGPLRSFTQFRGYTFRWLETVLGERTLDASAKKTMFLTSLLMSGTQGLLGRGLASSIYNTMSDFGWNEDVKQAVTQGILDWGLQESGYDISLGEFFEVNAADLFDGLLDVPPGISAVPSYFNTMVAPYAALYHFFHPENGEDKFPLSYWNWLNTEANLLAKEGQLPAGFSKALLALNVFGTEGGIYNRMGYKNRENMTTARKVLYGFGFKSIEEAENYYFNMRTKSVKEKVTNIAEEYIKTLTLSVEQPHNHQAYITRAYQLLSAANKELDSSAYSELQSEIKNRMRNIGKSTKENIIKGAIRWLPADEARQTINEIMEEIDD